ncbi:hypothetical protein [Roseicella aquatilis]|uniref:hypothetical protein n=1 Tax=Roseicella aquatilis TaxID=2527868 RepID=UPI001F0DCF30|nr:hypothetical protein [Roseicella aquatilis]
MTRLFLSVQLIGRWCRRRRDEPHRAGSEGGGESWAIATTLIRTAILNRVTPQA